MRTLSPALAAFLVAGCLVAGCHGSSSSQSTAPANTAVNPGPKSTAGDPGPNNTANGPETLQGTLVARSGCVELDGNAANEPPARFHLEFPSDTVSRHGTTTVLTGADGTRSIGPHDTIFVAGHPGAGSGPCGTTFQVEKVVAVTPG